MSINFFSTHIFQLFCASIISIILAIVILILLMTIIKQKKLQIILTIFFIITCTISSQVQPLFYTLKSLVLASNNDLQEALHYIDKATHFYTLPVHKGYLYAERGYLLVYFNKSNNKEVYYQAMQDFDRSYKYIKTYNTVFKESAILAYLPFDLDKVRVIQKEINDFKGLALIDYVQKDYSSALININKVIEKNVSAGDYAVRSAIYKQLNDEKKSKEDYKKAINMCKDDKCLLRVQKTYNDLLNQAKKVQTKSITDDLCNLFGI